ncbi:unnamed protein product [Kuraishia capsulata CBS 1993]|uniref:Uncharacterized protein n=1 Tax=Kuraishia capsulata CBS 1993 TaxID=1382522 RepID=W6MUF7_9ASCO|nr:uncharacterized protein KUCA_T00005230001 [Kuraishia capsulata CBS 1993]CDK29242.1 unnamed protein product [Kuraishia capsulata CBS 1993]
MLKWVQSGYVYRLMLIGHCMGKKRYNTGL